MPKWKPDVLKFLFKVVSEFEVTRRVLVDLEGISLRRKWLSGLEPENVHMMIGNLMFGNCVNKQFLPCIIFKIFMHTPSLQAP